MCSSYSHYNSAISSLSHNCLSSHQSGQSSETGTTLREGIDQRNKVFSEILKSAKIKKNSKKGKETFAELLYRLQMSDKWNDEHVIRRTMQQILDGIPREQSTEMSTWAKIDTRLNTAGIHPQSEKGGKILDYIIAQLPTRTNSGPADTNSIGRILDEIPREIILGNYKNELDSYSSREEGIDSESNERDIDSESTEEYIDSETSEDNMDSESSYDDCSSALEATNKKVRVKTNDNTGLDDDDGMCN